MTDQAGLTGQSALIKIIPKIRKRVLAGLSDTGPAGTISLAGLCMILMLTVAVINGRPFFFVDFNAYFSIGEILTERGTEFVSGSSVGHTSDSPVTANSGGTTSSSEETLDDGYFQAIAGGRSPLYSAFGYISTIGLSIWLICLIQTAIAAWLLIRTVDLFRGGRRADLILITVAGLTVLSSLGFHVNLTMPDIFAGFLVLGSIQLIFNRNMGPIESLSITALVAACALMHSTTLILGFVGCAIAIAFVLFRWSRHQVRMSAPLWLTVAIVCAVSTQLAYRHTIVAVTGERIGSPPFLMARVYDDGPGRLYLERACAEDPDAYALCAFNGYKFRNHNDLIWGSSEDGKPSFIRSSISLKRALQSEQITFVLNAVREHPLLQARATASNIFSQFFNVSIAEVDEGAIYVANNFVDSDPKALWYVPGLRACLSARNTCSEDNFFNTIWSHFVGAVNLISLASFLLILCVWTVRRFRIGSGNDLEEQDHFLALGWMILLLLAANAAVCGGVSGSHARYQARLVWIVPLWLILTAPYVRIWATLITKRIVVSTA